ncbi:MAG: ABC transporter permease subunit [Planctomycetaceae bacterium]|nr:MAG: ABC transporter permease subunit [Planctomycetaceae bacterium]
MKPSGLLGFAFTALLFAWSGTAPPTRAWDTLADARGGEPLRWGADQEGGAPYVFPSDQDMSQLVGFEVDLARELQRQLGVEIEFQQSQWDLLPSMLQARKVDFVMNGYEWFPDRAAAMETSIPYYVYSLQLEVARDGPIQSWEQLKRPKSDGSPWRFAVLSGSAAETYLKAFQAQGGAITYASYDGVTDSMREVETGKVDATLQDTPSANFYAADFPRLRFVEQPVAAGYYVIYARKGDGALIEAINDAIIRLYRNGTLETIYKKYGMWNEDQQTLGGIVENGKFYGAQAALGEAALGEAAAAEMAGGETPTPTGAPRRSKLRDYLTLLTKAAGMTIALSAISFPLAIALGILIATGRLYGPGWVRAPLAFYVEFLRGTPLMLQLYFIFFLLPELGIVIPPFPTAVLGLAINYSAYESEIYRAGLQAIPAGQLEAALSLGMSRRQSLRRIIVPQAFRIVIPPMVNDFIAMFKDTSVCSVVTIIELTKQFNVLSRNNVADVILLMAMTAALYLAMSYPMSVCARYVERRLGSEARA